MSQILPEHLSLWAYGLIVGAIILVRYALFAGIGFGVLRLFPKRAARRRISPVPVTRRQMWREAIYSVLTVAVFAAVFTAVFYAARDWGWFRIYRDAGAYGWAWYWLSLPAAVLIHDFYFYWAHRFMHLPGIYDHVHKVHHLSVNPTPLAAFAFHPVEAVIESLSFVIVVSVMPIHTSMLMHFAAYMMATNVMGHLGYEMFPRGFARSKWFGWLMTATCHNQHHRTYRYNYGLYTVIWDRLFGTIHPQYEALYDRITEDAAEAAEESGTPVLTQ